MISERVLRRVAVDEQPRCVKRIGLSVPWSVEDVEARLYESKCELKFSTWQAERRRAADDRVQALGQAGPPKSGKVRSVPLIDQAARALDTLSMREHFTGPDDLVFASETGGHFDEAAARNAFYEALNVAGLGDRRTKPDPIVVHDLRHTFGTLAVEVWSLHDVQAYMGHADIQTTMIYVHHVPKTAAADLLTRLVEKASGAASLEATAGACSVSPAVSRTAEFDSNSAQLSDTQTPETTGAR